MKKPFPILQNKYYVSFANPRIFTRATKYAKYLSSLINTLLNNQVKFPLASKNNFITYFHDFNAMNLTAK